MLKRIIFVIAASLLTVGAMGCACSSGTASPTPTASIMPVATPSTEPDDTPGADAGMSPDISSSPDAGAATGGGTIENFSEGTEVQPEDVPEIKKAVEEKYAGATIKSVKHATQNGRQVYAVEIDVDGKMQTVYVTADGEILEGNTAS